MTRWSRVCMLLVASIDGYANTFRNTVFLSPRNSYRHYLYYYNEWRDEFSSTSSGGPYPSIPNCTGTAAPVRRRSTTTSTTGSVKKKKKKKEEGGEGSLGDIMSSYETDTEITARLDMPIQSGLVTNSGGTLLQSFGSKTGGYLTPLERIALTANGNLQRIFSSYYDAPVHIHVDYCQKSSDNVWDRRVFLEVHSQTFCTALSKVYIRDQHCIHLVEDGSVGIGQLFRYLNILPLFCLQDVGRMDNGGIWRQYELTCNELTCHITEIFEPDAWILEPPTTHLQKSRNKSNLVNENDLLF